MPGFDFAPPLPGTPAGGPALRAAPTMPDDDSVQNPDPSRGRPIRLTGSCLRGKEPRHALEISVGSAIIQAREHTLHRLIEVSPDR